MHAALLVLSFAAALVAPIRGEQHTVVFDNQCGHGTPTLITNGQVVSKGASFTSNGPFSGIAYLQDGSCLYNGENCALLETTLINPTCPGCGSSSDISLIPPHAFNVPVSFSYFGGCDGAGAACNSPSCSKTAFFVSTDTQVQVACQSNNVNLKITFCEGSASAPTSTVKPAPTAKPTPKPTQTPTTSAHSASRSRSFSRSGSASFSGSFSGSASRSATASRASQTGEHGWRQWFPKPKPARDHARAFAA